MIVELVCVAVALLSFMYAVRCYYELWKWARQCQNVRIAVEYKGRVKTQQPVIEWLLWANQLDKDKDSRGRVIYHLGGTRIAILKGWGDTLSFPNMVQDGLRAVKRSVVPVKHSEAPPLTKQGRMQQVDETPADRKVTVDA